MTGRGPFVRVRPVLRQERGRPRRLAGDADRHALAADLGVRLVERLGQVGEQRHLFGGHSHVDSDAVRIEARRAGALAAVVAADAAAGRGGRGGGQRGRERGGGTSPGGPPGGHRRATSLATGLSAAIITSADGSPVPDGWVGCPFGSYVQGSSAVPRDSSRRPTASASAPATTTSARGSVGPPVSSSSRWVPLLAHLGRCCLHDVDPRLRQQDVERAGRIAVRGDGGLEAVEPGQERASSFSRSVPVKSVDPQ